jgi:hypothetical protein
MKRARHGLCLLLLVGAALLTGCAGLRWEAPPRNGPAPDPALARAVMLRNAPVRLQMVNSVLFEYRGRKMSGLGFLDVDARTRSFGLACMAQTGVTLFEVTGSNGVVRCRSALAAFADRPEFTETLARDVERMFFDLCPPPGAAESVEPGGAIFTSTNGPDRVAWMAGGDGALLEKRYYEKRRLVRRIGYYAPVRQDPRQIAGRVCLQNLQHGYGLTVTVREIRRCD